MRFVVYVPFAAALTVTLLAAVASRRLPPRIATWWLAGALPAEGTHWVSVLPNMASVLPGSGIEHGGAVRRAEIGGPRSGVTLFGGGCDDRG